MAWGRKKQPVNHDTWLPDGLELPVAPDPEPEPEVVVAPSEPEPEEFQEGIYRGILYCVDGNLFAQEEPIGQEVRHEPGVGYIYVHRARGDKGHFETHHQRFVTIAQTQDDSSPHHFAPLADDPNFDEHGNLRFHADHVKPTLTGHTDVYEPRHE